MPRSLPIIAVLTLLAQLPQARAASGCDQDTDAVREVGAIAMGIIAADNARDIERVLGYYSADAILMPPGEQPVVGLDAIRPRYEELFSGFNPEIEAHVEETCVEGALAFVRGRNGGWLVSRDGSGARKLDDVYLMVLQRNPESRWEIRRLMWHPASPGTRATPE